jgi:hypothetical protein
MDQIGRTFVYLSICLLARSCLGAARPRCLVAPGVPLSEGDRETGNHWVAHACMGVASSCVCCKPVAEGEAGVDLRDRIPSSYPKLLNPVEESERGSPATPSLHKARPLLTESLCVYVPF